MIGRALRLSSAQLRGRKVTMQIAAEDNKKIDERRADRARINGRAGISALLADYGRFYPQR